jgi:superfamily I DNA/RNA helicase
MLYSGRSVNVAGVDISTRLIKHMTKLGDGDISANVAMDLIEVWEAKKEASGAKNAKDMADCMRVFVKRSETLGGAIARARDIFQRSGTVSFMTGHKAKGLEFDRVYHLDEGLCLAGNGQDQNIRYVIDTRTTNELIYI